MGITTVFSLFTPLSQEVNSFVGAGPKLWECSENWESSDGKTAITAPCEKDRAFFRKVSLRPASCVCVCVHVCVISPLHFSLLPPTRTITTQLWSPISRW